MKQNGIFFVIKLDLIGGIIFGIVIKTGTLVLDQDFMLLKLLEKVDLH